MVVEEAQLIVHEADQPDVIGDLAHADGLTDTSRAGPGGNTERDVTEQNRESLETAVEEYRKLVRLSADECTAPAIATATVRYSRVVCISRAYVRDALMEVA